jgi:hypothetical protein
MTDILKELAGRLTIETTTKSIPYSGNIYLITMLKLDGEVISESETAVPDVGTLKGAEYNDY